MVVAGIEPDFVGASFALKLTDDRPSVEINDHRIRPSVGTTKQSLGEWPERHSVVPAAARIREREALLNCPGYRVDLQDNAVIRVRGWVRDIDIELAGPGAPLALFDATGRVRRALRAIHND